MARYEDQLMLQQLRQPRHHRHHADHRRRDPYVPDRAEGRRPKWVVDVDESGNEEWGEDEPDESLGESEASKTEGNFEEE